MNASPGPRSEGPAKRNAVSRLSTRIGLVGRVDGMKRLLLGLLLLLPTVGASDLSEKYPSSKEAVGFLEKFPTLAKLLAIEEPWKLPPSELVTKIFPPEMRLVQGSAEYPLLFDAQRTEQWAGLQVWDQLAYEVEYYVFGPARPVIRLHIGRPLDAGLQLTDYTLSDETKKLFPGIPESARKSLSEQVRKLVDGLKAYGARELPFEHPRIRMLFLPGGTKLTVSDFSGSGRGSVYLQMDLEPVKPITGLEHVRVPAFPGAQGFGSLTGGGRGGKIFLVTTLEDYLAERRDGRPDKTLGEEGRDGVKSECCQDIQKLRPRKSFTGACGKQSMRKDRGLFYSRYRERLN